MDLTPALLELAAARGGLLTAADLRAAGLTLSEVRRLVASGRLRRARPGVYAVLDTDDGRGADGPAGPIGEDPPSRTTPASRAALASRTALASRAALANRRGESLVLSHVSAARHWGCRVLRDDGLTHLTAPLTHSGLRGAIRLHRHPLPSDHVVELRGLRVTSLARTVVDCACALGFDDALVVADSALALGVTREDCRRALRPGRTGAPAARRVIDFADPRAESAGESLGRRCLAEAGLPPPVLQHDVTVGDRVYWTDFAWPGWFLIVEFDGRVKYTELSDDPATTAWDERRREVALQNAGWTVVRLEWKDLFAPARVRGFVLDAVRRVHGAGAVAAFLTSRGPTTPVSTAIGVGESDRSRIRADSDRSG